MGGGNMLNRLIYSYRPDMTFEFVPFGMLFWSVLFTGGYILYKSWKWIFKKRKFLRVPEDGTNFKWIHPWSCKS
jgi:hypothetical protein